MYIKLIGTRCRSSIGATHRFNVRQHQTGFSKSGFTLTEIIVSALLLALIAGGTLGAFVGAEKFIILTKHRMEALNFARKAMEILKGRYSYSDLGPPAPDPGEILQGDLARIGTINYTVEETQPDGYKKIFVRVEWNEPQL